MESRTTFSLGRVKGSRIFTGNKTTPVEIKDALIDQKPLEFDIYISTNLTIFQLLKNNNNELVWTDTNINIQPETNTLSIGVVELVEDPTNIEVIITGEAPNQILNFKLAPGPKGDPNTLTIGSVIKGEEASASITGEAPNQILNLVLPKGDKGSLEDALTTDEIARLRKLLTNIVMNDDEQTIEFSRTLKARDFDTYV